MVGRAPSQSTHASGPWFHVCFDSYCNHTVRQHAHSQLHSPKSIPFMCNFLLAARKQENDHACAVKTPFKPKATGARGQRMGAGWCTHSMVCLSSRGGGAALHQCPGHWTNLYQHCVRPYNISHWPAMLNLLQCNTK